MSARSFWGIKSSSAKDAKTGTPSTTPSTSMNDNNSDSQLNSQLEVSNTMSVRTLEEKSGSLTAAAVDSAFLWKQPSKRRLFGGVSLPQKRYFVITPNELGYKEKDNAEAEFKAIWKIRSEVVSVEMPSESSKDFTVVIMEGGVPRALKLSGPDAGAAKKFAAAIQAALKAAHKPKTELPNISTMSELTTDELTLEDANKSLALGAEMPSAISTIEEVSIQTDLTTEASVTEFGKDTVSGTNESLVADVLVPIPEVEDNPETKPAVWFWGMCCSAE